MLRPLAVACLVAICGAGSLGPFESNSDIGAGLQKGKVESSGPGEYRVTGGGADMWGKADAFHFVWKKGSAQESDNLPEIPAFSGRRPSLA